MDMAHRMGSMCVFLNRKEKRVRERVRERDGFVGMKKKRKEMRDLINIYIYIYICTKFLAGKQDSSLLCTCSDEIGFVTANVTKNTTLVPTTTFVSATTSFHCYFSHSATKLVSSLIV